MDWYKANKVWGFSDETIEKIRDFFYHFSRRNIKLTEEEKRLCQSAGIDPRLARIIKSHNTSEITLLPSVLDYRNLDFKKPGLDGICAFYVRKDDESMEDIHRVIYRNKQKYLKKGYNLFYFDGKQYGEYYMALAKNKTTSDILRWQQTNGVNHNFDNADVIAKIEKWQEQYDLVLWGCGGDWLHIFFVHEPPKYNGPFPKKEFYDKFKLWDKRTPKWRKFAEEVIQFCPDSITQIYRNKTELIREMEHLNGVYLWWD